MIFIQRICSLFLPSGCTARKQIRRPNSKGFCFLSKGHHSAALPPWQNDATCKPKRLAFSLPFTRVQDTSVWIWRTWNSFLAAANSEGFFCVWKKNVRISKVEKKIKEDPQEWRLKCACPPHPSCPRGTEWDPFKVQPWCLKSPPQQDFQVWKNDKNHKNLHLPFFVFRTEHDCRVWGRFESEAKMIHESCSWMGEPKWWQLQQLISSCW